MHCLLGNTCKNVVKQLVQIKQLVEVGEVGVSFAGKVYALGVEAPSKDTIDSIETWCRETVQAGKGLEYRQRKVAMAEKGAVTSTGGKEGTKRKRKRKRAAGEEAEDREQDADGGGHGAGGAVAAATSDDGGLSLEIMAQHLVLHAAAVLQSVQGLSMELAEFIILEKLQEHPNMTALLASKSTKTRKAHTKSVRKLIRAALASLQKVGATINCAAWQLHALVVASSSPPKD
jgi:hypothetical protein